MNDTEQNENSYGHVLKYTGIFGGVQGLNILISLVRNKLVALLLGPAGMGLAALFNSVVNFVSQATSFGISFSAVRHLSEIFDSGDSVRIRTFVNTVRAWCAVAALLGMAVCVASAPAVGRYVLDGDSHMLEIMALAPVVAMLAVTGGETAILKGARRLRELAVAQVCIVVLSLVLSVPLYWLLRYDGIVLVIFVTTAVNMLFTVRYSFRLFPVGGLACVVRRLGVRGVAAWLRRLLADGSGMVRLGVAFIVSGVFGSGAEMIIRSFLNNYADLNTVGLYNAGYVMAVTYAGMVFSAMETDYFPRLSAVNHDTAAVNLAANRQIEVSILMISPMLTLLITMLPILIPLLYSGRFVAVVPMAQVAVLSMYARAAMLPVAYITLAKGHSRAYMVIEGASAVVFVVLMIVCFNAWGLVGAGVAVLLSNVADLVVIVIYAAMRYGYRLSRQVVACAAVHVPLGLVAYLATFAGEAWMRVAVGVAATAVSTAVSAYVIYRKTTLWNKIKEKILSRAGK